MVSEMDKIINVTNLTKFYGKKQALSDVALSIPENSIVGLVGRNGSGKTTLMKILAGRLDKSGGDVKVFNEEPMDNLKVQTKLVYTYHNVPFDPNWNLKTILYGYNKMFPSFDNDFANKLMNLFDLEGKMKYRSLSQGMASVFNFLCALSCRASLTLLDEPVLGMDVTVRKTAYEILLRDFTEFPRTFIISSHLLSEIEGVLSDIVLIETGRIILAGSIDDVRNSAYRLDGNIEVIEKYVKDKKVIYKKVNEMSSFAIIQEKYSENVMEAANEAGLELSPVRTEDLCVYLTRQDKEGEIECLW